MPRTEAHHPEKDFGKRYLRMNDAMNSSAPLRPPLSFMEGLRGMTALYVVLYHAQQALTWRGDRGGLSEPLYRVTRWMDGGQASGRKPVVLRLLESRLLVRLGGFSYSLYLVHDPVLGVLFRMCRALVLSPSAMLLVLLSVGVPCAVGVGVVFHLVFERRWMTARRGNVRTNRSLLRRLMPETA